MHIRYKIESSAVINTDRETDDLTILGYYVGDIGNSSKSCPLPKHKDEYHPNVIVPPEVNSDFTVKLNNAGEIRGRIYSRGPVALSNKTIMTGAVTACQLQLTSQAQVIGESACFNPKEYFIDIIPEKDESLTCDRQKVTVRVLDKDGKIATDYTGDIHLSSSLTRAGKARWFGTESGGTSLGDVKNRVTVTPNSGQKTLWLKSEYIGKITVTATLSKDDKKTDSSTFLFVPYGFEIAEGEIL
ncbi:MSHA biogenesis protein MshQ [Photobacterium aphoticum]|uniref:MSHA biogenesis protein MshQ n=1 Tax=Photobacterium aphoticum TaxID=754436 RepID=A0A090QU26_9GAMM|nr:MSHA biogenesis protein MshQ [Photobacterium aphoticum]